MFIVALQHLGRCLFNPVEHYLSSILLFETSNARIIRKVHNHLQRAAIAASAQFLGELMVCQYCTPRLQLGAQTSNKSTAPSRGRFTIQRRRVCVGIST